MDLTRVLPVAALTAVLLMSACSDGTSRAGSTSTTVRADSVRSSSLSGADVESLLLLLSPVAPCPPPTPVPVVPGDLGALLEVLGLAPPSSTVPCTAPTGAP